MVRIERVTSKVAIDRLVREWRVLWQKVPDATPFQSPEWLLSWWGCFGNGAPFVLTAREDGQLIAVLPLYEYDEAGCRKLLPIGSSLSDYLDALVDSNDTGAAGALLASLVDLPGWEECYIPDLPPRAALLTARSPARLMAHRSTGETCPVLALPGKHLFGVHAGFFSAA
jgi:hypothetical protein